MGTIEELYDKELRKHGLIRAKLKNHEGDD